MLQLKHIKHYLILVLGLLVSFVVFILVKFNPAYQFSALAGGVLYYVLWGIIHHRLEGRFDFSIIFEYILVGGIVLFLYFLLLIAF